MDLGFAGSTAVVTGGSKGMGLAIAETLAAEGANVAVMARNREALDVAVTSLRAAGAPDAMGISADMADAESIAEGFARVSDRWGRLNCLIHTIGPGDGYFEQMDDTRWDATFALGTMSAVR
ncbi:MAG: 3-oxoacyl-[acyl-carrier protein] reductase, partial [Mycobacterium sp.]|nr:3-oxoacyl-[acyl-carrier protein] reductase [Mycobacterium sp.]